MMVFMMMRKKGKLERTRNVSPTIHEGAELPVSIANKDAMH